MIKCCLCCLLGEERPFFPPLHFPYFLTHFYDNSRPFTEISPLSPSPPSPPPSSIHTCLCASDGSSMEGAEYSETHSADKLKTGEAPPVGPPTHPAPAPHSPSPRLPSSKKRTAGPLIPAQRRYGGCARFARVGACAYESPGATGNGG